MECDTIKKWPVGFVKASDVSETNNRDRPFVANAGDRQRRYSGGIITRVGGV